jgi:hypothetical protein
MAGVSDSPLIRRLEMALIFTIVVSLLSVSLSHASEVTDLAACNVKIFEEIGKTRKWSGKPPAGCPETVAVEKRREGVFVTSWVTHEVEGGWTSTAFSSALGYGEITDRKDLATANRDIMSRAGRLGRCLDSIISVNDPLECRQKAIKSYLAGESTGEEYHRTIWLDDDGRHAVVEFAYGNSGAEPAEPADLLETPPLPPGMVIEVYPQKGGKKNRDIRQR